MPTFEKRLLEITISSDRSPIIGCGCDAENLRQVVHSFSILVVTLRAYTIQNYCATIDIINLVPT